MHLTRMCSVHTKVESQQNEWITRSSTSLLLSGRELAFRQLLHSAHVTSWSVSILPIGGSRARHSLFVLAPDQAIPGQTQQMDIRRDLETHFSYACLSFSHSHGRYILSFRHTLRGMSNLHRTEGRIRKAVVTMDMPYTGWSLTKSTDPSMQEAP